MFLLFLVALEGALAAFPRALVLLARREAREVTGLALVAHGDSLTTGGSRGEVAWAEWLERDLDRLGVTDVTIVNNARQGAAAVAMRTDLLPVLEARPAGAPTVLLLWIGHNDFVTWSFQEREAFARRGAAVANGSVEAAGPEGPRLLRVARWGAGWLRREVPVGALDPMRARGFREHLGNTLRFAAGRGIRTYVATYPVPGEPAADADAWDARVVGISRATQPAINAELRAAAREAGAELLDLATDLPWPETYDPHLFLDNIHLSDAGHRRVATYVRRRLVIDGVLPAAALD
ncbi:MAG: GDSL-type esterase/lipase family protein [Myxococcota bacterium]